MKSVPVIGSILVLAVITVSIVHSAPTSEKPVVTPSNLPNDNADDKDMLPADSDNPSEPTLMQRVGRFLGVSLGVGLGGIGFLGDPYPFGQPYPCTVYGYPAPYAPPGSTPCGRPYYFG